MEDLIGKKFIEYRHARANIYKIIAFDEETDRYIVRNNNIETFTYYHSYKKEELDKCYFDKDEAIEIIDKKNEDANNRYNKFLPIVDRLQHDELFAHNFRGVCEGLKNIKAVTGLLSYYTKGNADKYFNEYNKILLDASYKSSNPEFFNGLMLSNDKIVLRYKKEINAYIKGIKRNKKILFRICTEDEYNYLEKIYSNTALEDIFEIKNILRKLENEKKDIIEAFNQI